MERAQKISRWQPGHQRLADLRSARLSFAGTALTAAVCRSWMSWKATVNLSYIAGMGKEMFRLCSNQAKPAAGC